MQDRAHAAEIRQRQESLRHKRRLAQVQHRRRLRLAIAFGVLCVIVACVVIVVIAGGSTERIGDQSMLLNNVRSPSAPVAVDGEAHPTFARLGDRNLLLPVASADATIIAYQAVSDDRATPITPIGERANANALVRFFRGIFASEPLVRYYVLDGPYGSETTSVLVGAPVGSPVMAPISGAVVAVKEYMLYGKYPDVQIDLRPEQMSGATLSLLFIQDPVVSIGDIVTAGKTQLGNVRACPEDLGANLAVYTHEAGAHVYMQVTEEPVN
jgi:hypothetical protein